MPKESTHAGEVYIFLIKNSVKSRSKFDRKERIKIKLIEGNAKSVHNILIRTGKGGGGN
jgi:hypothetical protein